PAALPHLRTLRRRAAPAERARAAVARNLRPPRIEDIRLVGAWARPAVSVLRRSHECPARSAARAHAERARSPLNGAPGLPTSVTKQGCQIHLSSSTATLRSMVERITVPQGCLPYRHRGFGCRNFIKSRSAIRVRPLSAPSTSPLHL